MRRCTVIHKDGLQPLAFRLALVEHFEMLHDWLLEPGLNDLDVVLRSHPFSLADEVSNVDNDLEATVPDSPQDMALRRPAWS